MGATWDLSRVAKALNRVESVGQARAALGAVLNHLSAAYAAWPDAQGSYGGQGQKAALDGARVAVESYYKQLPTQLTAPAPHWSDVGQPAANRAIVEAEGIIGSAEAFLSIDTVEILEDAIRNAPSVLAAAIGTVAGEVAKQTGRVSGELVWSFLKAAWPIVLLVVVIAVGYLVLRSFLAGRSK